MLDRDVAEVDRLARVGGTATAGFHTHTFGAVRVYSWVYPITPSGAPNDALHSTFRRAPAHRGGFAACRLRRFARCVLACRYRSGRLGPGGPGHTLRVPKDQQNKIVRDSLVLASQTPVVIVDDFVSRGDGGQGLGYVADGSRPGQNFKGPPGNRGIRTPPAACSGARC